MDDPPSKPHRMARILLVEDERAIRNVLRNILLTEDKAHVIAEAENGQEALDALAVGTFDLVLCDIKMPLKDGIEVLDYAVAHAPETRRHDFRSWRPGHGSFLPAQRCF